MRSLLTTLLLLAATTLAAAQPFPTPGRPIVLMNGFPAGTGNDIYSRLLAGPLAAALGVPVIVEARTGASGNLATEYVAAAPPDGHAILLTTSAMVAINPHLFRHMAVDPRTALAPVITLADVPNVLTVSATERPALTSCAALVAAARAAPGRLNYASSGAGASTHLAGAAFAAATGTDLVHVPYRGGTFAMTALLAGDVDLFFYQVAPVMDFYREGRVRLLGVTSRTRVPVLPDVPTIAEACDLPGFESTTWYGLSVPARTPPATVDRLYREVRAIITAPAFAARVVALGFAPMIEDPDAMRAHMARDYVTWGEVVARTGARAD